MPSHERWTLSIDGHQRETLSPAPEHVLQAIADAYPLPATITEAAAEFALWERRDRDLGLVLRDTSDSQLDLPAYLRRDLVRSRLETELRAASLSEVLIRQRHLVEQEVLSSSEIERAVLLDLEHLVGQGAGEEEPVPVRTGRPKPGKRSERAASTVEPCSDQPDMFA